MSDKLEVQIGANIKELQQKLSEAQKKIDSFSKSSDKNLDKFGKASVKASKDVTKLGKGAISGSSAMTSFNRTIQDAPFGLMGVSNNITNLTEQFGYLKAKTGSAGGALKAMLRDLKGFGGISLVVSLATSLMLVFGDKLFETKDKVKELRKAQEDLTKSLDDYAFGLDSVNKAKLKGEQKAQKELLNLRLLKSVVEDTTKSTNERAGAVKDLRNLYPEYLKNLTDEQIKSGSLTTVYDKLTTSILKRAKATASMNMIVKNSEQLLNLESQLASKRDEIAKKEIQYEKDKAKIQKGGSYRTGTKDFEKQVERSAVLIEKLKKQANDLQGAMQGIELDNIELEQNVDLTSVITSGGAGEEESKIRTKVSSIFDTLKGVTNENIQGFNESLLNTPISLLGSTLTQFDLEAMNMKTKLAQFTEDTRDIINKGTIDLFGGLAESIGSGLVNGTNLIEGLGGVLLSTLGGVLTKLGYMTLATGTALEAIKKALLNPLTGGLGAIGAGLALIAVGSAFSAGAKSLASGGSSGSGSLSGSSGSNATSNTGTSSFSGGSSSGFSSGSGGGTVVFEIAGNKLVGVLSNTLRQNRSLGGSLIIT